MKASKLRTVEFGYEAGAPSVVQVVDWEGMEALVVRPRSWTWQKDNLLPCVVAAGIGDAAEPSRGSITVLLWMRRNVLCGDAEKASSDAASDEIMGRGGIVLGISSR